MMRCLILLTVLGLASTAHAVEPRCFAGSERWSYDRAKETLAAPGERFLDDVRACDPSFAAAVVEAVRYQIQSDEAQKFVRAKRYVLGAYGVAWALLALSGLALYLRQRRFSAEIAALEAKLGAAGAKAT